MCKQFSYSSSSVKTLGRASLKERKFERTRKKPLAYIIPYRFRMFQLLKIKKKYNKKITTTRVKKIYNIVKRKARGPRMCVLRGHGSSPARWFNNYFIPVIFIRCLFLNETRTRARVCVCVLTLQVRCDLQPY